MIEDGWSIEKTKPTGVLVLLDYHHLVIQQSYGKWTIYSQMIYDDTPVYR